MKTLSTATYSIALPVSAQVAFDYHARRGALQRLLPPWLSVRIESSDESLADGSRVVMRMRIAGLPIRWVAEHTGYDPPQRFEDVQVCGPFSHWHHRHLIQAEGDHASRLTDVIEYRLPAGRLGRTVGDDLIRRQLDRMFAYRHSTTLADLALSQRSPLPAMRIAISGSHGLIGSQLRPLLTVLGHEVLPIVRQWSPKEPSGIAVWDGAKGVAESHLRGLDAVIHLAGKPIAAQRWTTRVKQEIRDSRVQKTRQLCERLASLGDDGPRTLLCASATGIYGDRGDEYLTETSADGKGLLADVARQWEDACSPARDAGIRVVHLRFGIILSPRDGALAKLLTPGRWGLNGPIGSGRQWWSWIGIDDCVSAIYHALATEQLRGPVNVVAPVPVTNREFMKTLGRVLSRPAVLPLPAAALRLALGEMADALLLASARVVPDQLQQSKFSFRFPTLEPTLRHLLGRPAGDSDKPA